MLRMGIRGFLTGYSPVGDLTVVSVCLVMIILLVFSYVRKSRSFKVFLSIVGLLIAAAYTNVAFHMMVERIEPRQYPVAYTFRCLYHALLFLIFVMYVVYIGEVTRLESEKRTVFVGLAIAIFITVVGIDVVDTLQGTSLRITEDGVRFQQRSVFIFGYMAFVAVIIVMMFMVRKRLYKRVMLGFYGTMAVSFSVLLIQGIYRQSSFTVDTFMFPAIAMFYIMHSNPYDVALGAIDSRALEDTVRYNYEKKRSFAFMSLYMRAFDEEGKVMSEELQATIRSFTSDFFRGATLFQVDRGHVVLVFLPDRNPDYERRIEEIMQAFYVEYERFKLDFKIVIGESVPDVSRRNEYVSFIRGIHRGMAENTVHRVKPQDVDAFNRTVYILQQLEDIHRRRDMNDPRVLAFCQPVYNLRSQGYDTAEALMRLKLDEIEGPVPPAQFIPLAEENGYIHTLTEIILNKTCRAVRLLTDGGYRLSRVSVNVSALELKDDRFCEDITRIIDQNGIPGDRIAIELTESQTDSDFELAKRKISELREKGIIFYLDDFGTGYSNMERIMELPFDIIKFDRSMVAASAASERSRKLVVGLANMFSELEYSVLYEGVERDADEDMCRGMSASYLQGYRYSQPVPIERLKEFLGREGNSDEPQAEGR